VDDMNFLYFEAHPDSTWTRWVWEVDTATGKRVVWAATDTAQLVIDGTPATTLPGVLDAKLNAWKFTMTPAQVAAIPKGPHACKVLVTTTLGPQRIAEGTLTVLEAKP
jgi:hypothetical protein